MLEITDHSAYKLIRKFNSNGCVLDYVILQNDLDSADVLQHKKAAIAAMSVINKRMDDYAFDKIANDPLCKKLKRKDFPFFHWDEASMTAHPYSVEHFFTRPKDNYYFTKPNVTSRVLENNGDAEYALAFLEPPYGNKYLVSDWETLNGILFPDPANIEIYKWNTSWSDYFDAGLEWWGAFYWTVYDSLTNCFIVIGGSTTD